MSSTPASPNMQKGLAFFRKHNPAAAQALEEKLGDFAPDLLRLVAEFPFGEMYGREGLGPKVRQAATLSALACGGHDNQLRIHIGIAHSLGFTRDELVELFMQLAPYAGFPVTINAVLAVKEVYPDS
ncbi:carboxymuconolactone decarboxylase family protein [Halomonas sp. DN3]|uniref:carboxymuconolactone decarboxylase family protein n=1 Tax=Halomonas sp. DN3 TaxID=2953657 RepID=UPI0020A04A2C|nr:carboxymuconolactone decarboxylase family protein [Halomonas sp. DN3]USZ49268.1 carboxymuconolactone decarboxylase family protein [Halomonas sp. DN3]